MSTGYIAPPPPASETMAISSGESPPIAMRRLPFTLPDFTRMTWVSDSAREVWAPRLHRITNAWIEIEWLAIVSGIRSCSITMATPEQFVERGARWTQFGLNALPVEIQGLGRSGYSSTHVRTEMGKPFFFRFVLGAPERVAEFKKAWDSSDDNTIGKLLGYPPCCREFFKRVWVDQGLVDTTWPMAAATSPRGIESRQVEIISPTQANILWRWMGVRAVSHLPCSFCCKATVELADRFIDVGRNRGFDMEMDWLRQILDWPVEWSALHGIAEIKTPILKVSTRTDATPCKYTVRYKGNSYPAEGIRGLNFPFRAPSIPLLTESPGFRRGLDNPIGGGTPLAQWYSSDNGFSSIAEMDTSHGPILRMATAVLAASSGSVLDLGCGNGVLLKNLLEANPSVIPFGIDCDPNRIAHAGTILSGFAHNFIVGDMYESETIWPRGRRYALAILMPGRLVEVGSERTAQLKARLSDCCDTILIYAYGDWLARYGTLKRLAAAAGLELLGSDENAAVGFAHVLGPRCDAKNGRGGPLPPFLASRFTALNEASGHKQVTAKGDETEIDWRRVARPQPDQYDTDVTLRFAAANGYVRSGAQRRMTTPGFFDGAIEIGEFQGIWAENCCPASFAHSNIPIASELIRLWPDVYVQFKSLVERVYLFDDTSSSQDDVVGSICASGPEGFGSIAATVTHHIGFAEALVHEVSHHKLRALGVEFESAHRLVTNPPNKKYRSPIRHDCLRPMPAVLHAQYSYTYIAALDVKILQNTSNYARNLLLVRNSLAVIVPKLEFGLVVLREHATFDEAGKEFIEGMYDWSECIISDAKRLFLEFGISPNPFTHPLQPSE